MNLRENVLPLREISSLKKRLANSKIALVGGCFDVFHYGHLHFLLNAKQEDSLLVVLIESDEFIRIHKKKEPFHTQMQRAHIVAELRVVDYVIVLPYFEHPDKEYRTIVSILKPTVIPITKGDVRYKKKALLAEHVGARLIEINPLTPFSSSQMTNYASILRN